MVELLILFAILIVVAVIAVAVFGGQSRPETIEEVTTRLAGVSYRQEAIRHLFENSEPGQELELVRDPENKHDPFAVKVCDPTNGSHLGYIPRGLSPDVAEVMDAGRTARVVIEDFTGEDFKFMGIEVCLLLGRPREDDWE